MIEGEWKERKTGVAPLQDTDKSTFARFVEFIYTGDYNPDESTKPPKDTGDSADEVVGPPPAVLEDAEPEVYDLDRPVPPPVVFENHEPPYVIDTLEPVGGWGDRYRKPKQKKQRSTAAASQRFEPSPVIIQQPMPTCSAFVWDGDQSLDYLPVFLSHAKLYVFADKYDVANLSKLTAQRLEEALNIFGSPLSPTNIAALIRYIYQHTYVRKGDEDPLQKVVTSYAANNIELLNKCSDFRDLVKDQGSFAVSLTSKMCARIEG